LPGLEFEGRDAKNVHPAVKTRFLKQTFTPGSERNTPVRASNNIGISKNDKDADFRHLLHNISETVADTTGATFDVSITLSDLERPYHAFNSLHVA